MTEIVDMTPSTPKTFIHMARDAPMGVVLYRKSHLTTYVLKLDHKDRLIKGSRFYGRLFPERCDVSPDGRLFVYFAMRGKLTDGKANPSTWTAVCEPPFLKALAFAPNDSTWGGGGLFLRDRRLVLFDTPEGATDTVGGYRLVQDKKALPAGEKGLVATRFQPPPELVLPSPRLAKRMPHILRRHRRDIASGYDMFDYVLQNPDGTDVAGAEDIILANWAGWDFHGRLVVASGRLIKIYDVKPGKPLYKPVNILDIEAAIA
jgi:hypothetical protein